MPYGDNGGWPAIHLHMMLSGHAIPVHVDAPSVYHPLHADDILAMVPRLLGAASVPAVTVNWGGSEPVSIEEWCTYLAELAGTEARFEPTEQTIDSVEIDTTRMHELVGADDGPLARGHAPHGQGAAPRPGGVNATPLRAVRPGGAAGLASSWPPCGPSSTTTTRRPAGWTTRPLLPAELRPPGGAYLVGYEGADAVAGGGLRRLADGVAEIKRMYVRPDARSRGVAAALLAALESEAVSLGYARGPPRHRSQAGARAAPVPADRVRGGAGVQRQPVRLLLGGEAAGVSRRLRRSGARTRPRRGR